MRFVYQICRLSVCAFVCLALFSIVAVAGESSEIPGDGDYRIGAGDVLKISVWKEPDVSLDAAVVRVDGKLTYPLLDDIKAAGLTTMELKNIIQKGMSEYVEAPMVTVTLIDPGSQKFYILGEINNTGEYPIQKSLTILQAFTLAKGFTEWASKKEIILFRREGGKEKIIRVNYKDIIKGDFSNNVLIQADDTIIVP